MKMQTKVTVKTEKQLVVNVAVGDSRVRVVAVYKYSSGFSTLLFCIIYLYLMIIREIYSRARARHVRRAYERSSGRARTVKRKERRKEKRKEKES